MSIEKRRCLKRHVCQLKVYQLKHHKIRVRLGINLIFNHDKIINRFLLCSSKTQSLDLVLILLTA